MFELVISASLSKDIFHIRVLNRPHNALLSI